MSLIIVGAGMAGLLAANMLRHHDPVVVEAAPSIPNNHSAVLRFRSSIVSDVLGIPFRKVKMIKAHLPWMNPVADSLAYSHKNSGTYRSDRSIITSGIETHERFIAPPDLISQMARNVNIKFDQQWTFSGKDKVISTIPMPALMDALEYPETGEVNFEYRDGINLKAEVYSCDAYASLMVPDPSWPFSRVSVTGSELIVECPLRRGEVLPEYPTHRDLAASAAGLLGISIGDLGKVTAHRQRYQKITPINEEQRRAFIYWASVITGKAYQLGRFATWRPHLMLDDLVKDVRLIDQWIKSKTPAYDMHLYEANRK